MSRHGDAVKTFQNYIGGRWCDSAGGETFDDVNPADTGEVVARCQQSTAADMQRAVAAAAAAFPAWRATDARQTGRHPPTGPGPHVGAHATSSPAI